MSASSNRDSDLAALQADLAALKRDVADLVQNLKTGASNTAQSAAANVEEGVRQLYRGIAAEGEKSVKAIGQQVEEQPFLSLLIAFGIGYFGGVLMAR